jgi:hypothetical protein
MQDSHEQQNEGVFFVVVPFVVLWSFSYVRPNALDAMEFKR